MINDDEDILLLDEEGGEGDGERSGDELFEHFALTVDKGQAMMRIDKFLTIRMEQIGRASCRERV